MYRYFDCFDCLDINYIKILKPSIKLVFYKLVSQGHNVWQLIHGNQVLQSNNNNNATYCLFIFYLFIYVNMYCQ